MHSLSLIPCSNLYTCANRIAITHAPTPSRVLHCSTFSLLELENRGLIGPKDLITHGGGANVIGVHQELGQKWTHSNTQSCKEHSVHFQWRKNTQAGKHAHAQSCSLGCTGTSEMHIQTPRMCAHVQKRWRRKGLMRVVRQTQTYKQWLT